MNAVRSHFDEKGFVYLSNVIDKNDCDTLTKYMFSLHEKGETRKDEQCPLSDSIYGCDAFDEIAVRIIEPLSKQVGINLSPTYTYSRIYRKGETLTPHVDRPSCEVSATLTLGFDPDSAIWPIFFDTQKHTPITIEQGDLVLYKGCDVAHWREEYKGEWQVQVFFHFVKSDGDNKHLKYDGRNEMSGTNKTPILDVEGKDPVEEVQDPVKAYSLPLSRTIKNGIMISTHDDLAPGLFSFNSKFRPDLAFTAEECQRIIDMSKDVYSTKPSVGSDSTQEYKSEIREVELFELKISHESEWLFTKIAEAVGTANAEYYRYDLLGITHSLQLLRYKSDDEAHYDWHIDMGNESSATRKISISVPLNEDYTGGELEIWDNGVLREGNREMGSINMFPSYSLHRVKKVESGERWSLVIWIHGSSRFR